MHPADFDRLTDMERTLAVHSGCFDGRHWKVERVAELTGLDPDVLDEHVSAERGWEPHDHGYLHAIIESARLLVHTV